MNEDLKTRLENCDRILLEIYRETPDEEIRATCNNIRVPVVAMLSELECNAREDTEQEAERVIMECARRIKSLKEEVAGAATVRSPNIFNPTNL